LQREIHLFEARAKKRRSGNQHHAAINGARPLFIPLISGRARATFVNCDFLLPRGSTFVKKRF
jgi:hypothetical protein